MKQKAKKSLGQHFLRCNWVISTLIKTAEIGPEDTVLEIGPGTGILTRALAAHAKRIIAVEKDEKLAKELETDLHAKGISNTEIIKGDILSLFQAKPGTELLRSRLCSRLSLEQKYKVVANIPYYLTSRLLRLLFENKPYPKLIVLTIQKEVAKRITAKPSKMNLLALSVQAYGNPEIIKTVPANCFYPKPKVDSAIIKISDISDLFFKENKITEQKFFGTLKTAFSQKRKQLSHTLRLKKTDAAATLRPEELYLEDWIKIIPFAQ